jgi:hypothetical protein
LRHLKNRDLENMKKSRRQFSGIGGALLQRQMASPR